MNYKYLFLIFGLLLACGKKKESISPEQTDISESVYASGFVKSENQYNVYSKVVGVVAEIFVEEGTWVTKGTPILRIDNTNSMFNSDNARLAAIANDFSANQGKLKDAKNAVELAIQKMQSDSLAYKRQQQLWSENIGSKIDLEMTELSYSQAKVNLKKAQVNYDDINRQLQLASDQSKNNLKIAEATVADLVVRSAVDGFVYKVNVNPGELASSASPLAVIGKRDFLIEMNVDELDIIRIKIGQKVIVRMDSYQNQVFEAKISNIYPMMNERTRTFRVEAVFTKSPKTLYPNLTLESNIVIREKGMALTIPTRYLVEDSYVILEDGTKKSVKIGLRDYSLTEILGGIDKKSKIVLPNQ